MMRAIGFTHQGPTCTWRKDHWRTELLQKIQSNGGRLLDEEATREGGGDFAAPFHFLKDKKHLGGGDCNIPKLSCR